MEDCLVLDKLEGEANQTIPEVPGHGQRLLHFYALLLFFFKKRDIKPLRQQELANDEKCSFSCKTVYENKHQRRNDNNNWGVVECSEVSTSMGSNFCIGVSDCAVQG